MKVAIVILASLAMASSQDRVNVVDNAPGQIVVPANVLDRGFYRPSNPDVVPAQNLDPGFYQPSNPNLGPGQIVPDPGFNLPSVPPGHPGHPGSTLYPNPGYSPISTGPAIVNNPPPPHWSETQNDNAKIYYKQQQKQQAKI